MNLRFHQQVGKRKSAGEDTWRKNSYLVHDVGIQGSSNVVEDKHPALGRSVREESRAVNCAWKEKVTSVLGRAAKRTSATSGKKVPPDLLISENNPPTSETLDASQQPPGKEYQNEELNKTPSSVEPLSGEG